MTADRHQRGSPLEGWGVLAWRVRVRTSLSTWLLVDGKDSLERM
jgi:hypothetical protein